MVKERWFYGKERWFYQVDEYKYINFPVENFVVCEAYIDFMCLTGPIKREMEVGDLIRHEDCLCMIDRIEKHPDEKGYLADFHSITPDELTMHNIMKD